MNILSLPGTFLQRFRHSVCFNPARDWLIILIFFGIAFASIVLWNIQTFETVMRGGVVGDSTGKVPLLLDKTLLGTMRATFDSRAVERTKYETGTYHFADPSQ